MSARKLVWIFKVGIAATSLYIVVKKRPKSSES
jgi:hypothetical protein